VGESIGFSRKTRVSLPRRAGRILLTMHGTSPSTLTTPQETVLR
jgi:hypothetical protein